MTEQDKTAIENYVAEAVAICVNELGLTRPLNVVNIDMGGHIVAAQVHDDGRIEPLVDPGRGVSAPLYPVHTLVVDRDGNSATLVLEHKGQPMKTLH